ncbi:Cof-type HAD-IIB family hydrolase [Gloeobacter kilaueensis]|uniref:Cof hydrolase n=1 Tax=Gloeobacter kilaueensis (strain ATCC BAA-2537 / CCAP 1431/1 / ULC 316 / JS1) TaxID=1183438 RepID=U5QDS1_GLOK1|nr:Cof-type HAD-IIB family hydrolase [Gloeobacter kilaueensis]AGY57013.1 Cof hydrolase [Gloeobacter kilaueensis JS1]
MPITLLVLDLDGTIIGNRPEVRQAVLTAIQAARRQGVKVAIATGRMYRAALPFYRMVGSELPLICYQGALIKDPADGRVLLHRPVPIERTFEVLDFLEGEGLAVHLYLNDTLYVNEITPAIRRYGERTGVEPVPVGDLRRVLTAEPTKILGHTDSEQTTDALLKRLGERYSRDVLYLTKSDPTFVEVTHPEADKGLAVRFLAEQHLQISPEQVMTVGDQLNDLEMIRYAAVGVAMGRAPAAVQAEAVWVAPDVEADGVAQAIEKFILLPDPLPCTPTSAITPAC